MSDVDNLKKTIDRVSDIIDEAISSNDYTDLSRQIGGLMRDATDAVQKTATYFASGVSGASRRDDLRQGSSRREQDDTVQRMRAEAKRKAKEKADREAYEAQYFVKEESDTGSKILAVIGGAVSVVFGAVTILSGVISSAAGGFIGSVGSGLTVITGIITACGLAMMYFGRKASRKNLHFKKYRAKLRPHLYAEVGELAKEAGVSEKQAVSELKEFTKKGMFRQGHFDEQEKTFMASDEVYEQYKVMAQRAKEQRELEEAARREAEAKDGALTPEVRELLDKGNAYIRMIHEANERIPGEEVSGKLDRMEQITRRIFDEVSRRPELAGSLNMFMNYYLPTTTKLVKAYEEMDQQPVQGENIRTAKREIENSLDTISDAFEKLLDSFFHEQAMDVSSDINVMKMMMKQEGLTEDDLTVMRRKQAAEEAWKKAKAAGAAQVQTAGAAQAQAAGAAQAQTAGAAQAQTAGAAQVQTAGSAQAQTAGAVQTQAAGAAQVQSAAAGQAQAEEQM